MEFTTAQPETPRRSGSATPWQALTDTCCAAVTLSRDIATRLRQGAPAHALIPQLQHQAELAEQLRTGIGQLGKEAPSPTSATQRARLLRQFEDLLAQEQENHRLMSRRGVKLSGARPYRYTPPKT